MFLSVSKTGSTIKEPRAQQHSWIDRKCVPAVEKNQAEDRPVMYDREGFVILRRVESESIWWTSFA